MTIYLFNYKIALKKSSLEDEQKKKLALSLAIFTAPYTFYIPTAWLFRGGRNVLDNKGFKLFMTSSIGGSYIDEGVRIPCQLDESNQLLSNLKKYWPNNAKGLLVSSDPENEEINDSFRKVFLEAFRLSSLSFSEFEVCDRRNERRLIETIGDYDVILLAGGHVPTQNAFFRRINLKNLIRDYKGIIIGISAGSMNCADTVYAQPELDGEAINQNYQRYMEGLNLTNISILPHYQYLVDISIDGLRVVEDISLPDSKTRPFYALVDGAYIFIHDNKATVYGEAYYFSNGTITKVCDTDKYVEIS